MVRPRNTGDATNREFAKRSIIFPRTFVVSQNRETLNQQPARRWGPRNCGPSAGFTWTCRDGLEQFDKLRSVFEAAAFSEDYFCNRALFADHFLLTRLREDPAWRDNPVAGLPAGQDR